ncbi:TRAP transporter small permease [Muricauda sp. CAU 1633]|uniref:TRAP transporter small permease n=1 Tax=Allomuricauda sp. CAU 1633 TaxID=2816036 RepID=UPI001A8EE450|nr:TRAP transporter small permease [Muricauda sp. CAU 1633]MBO0324100.1 TRAP transporter small permease [Muricauda sp. CAU 1633]
MKLRQKIDAILGKVLMVIMGVMVINVLWQVFSRYLVGIPSSFTDELARYLMIWLGIIGAAYVSGRKMHVAIDILPSRLSKKSQKKFSIVANAIIILFCLTGMVIGGFRLVHMTYTLEQYSPSLQIPLALVYIVIPISGLIIIFYKVLDILNLTKDD